MNKKKRQIYTLCYIAAGILLLAFLLLIVRYNTRTIKQEKPLSENYFECDHLHNATAPIEPSDKLNDPNATQLIHAQKNGLKKPFKNNDEFNNEIDGLIRKFTLVKLTENRFYQLKTLTHSQPYLIPEAIDMLNEIGYRFQKELAEKKYNNYRFRITSVLRTEETQNNLCRRNGNATEHSAHIYGTTMDISYKNFYNTRTDTLESSYEAVQTLTKVLREMRKECKLLAIRERHQSCFHITVVVCRPKGQ